MKKKKKLIFDLDTEEKELSESFDRGEWESVDNLEEEKSKARTAAANYLRKSARINVRISKSDLEHIKNDLSLKKNVRCTTIS